MTQKDTKGVNVNKMPTWVEKFISLWLTLLPRMKCKVQYCIRLGIYMCMYNEKLRKFPLIFQDYLKSKFSVLVSINRETQRTTPFLVLNIFLWYYCVDWICSSLDIIALKNNLWYLIIIGGKKHFQLTICW